MVFLQWPIGISRIINMYLIFIFVGLFFAEGHVHNINSTLSSHPDLHVGFSQFCLKIPNPNLYAIRPPVANGAFGICLISRSLKIPQFYILTGFKRLDSLYLWTSSETLSQKSINIVSTCI